MKVTGLLVAAAVTLAASAPTTFAAEPALLEVIPSLLAKNTNLEHHGFSARLLKNDWVISYCPDNTCDVIRAPKQVSRAVLGDFSLLWLYYASGYIYLKGFIEIDAPPLVAAALDRRSGGCRREPEFALASCVLSTMAESNKIRLAFRRSDEGGTVEGRKTIKESLSEARIGEIRAWQTNAWKK
jgi:hypothetical protein